MRLLLLSTAAVFFFVSTDAKASINCNDRTCYADAKQQIHRRHVRIAGTKHVHRAIHSRGERIARVAVEGARRGGLTTVCAGNHCGTVIASAAEKFKGLFEDLLALGYNLGSPGCYSPTGHMRNSLHHWGGACDLFNQVARNRTALPQPPASVQIELAAKHGLTAGASWCNPDGGHFDLSGYNGCHGHGTYAMARHRHYTRHRAHVRYARG